MFAKRMLLSISVGLVTTTATPTTPAPATPARPAIALAKTEAPAPKPAVVPTVTPPQTPKLSVPTSATTIPTARPPTQPTAPVAPALNTGLPRIAGESINPYKSEYNELARQAACTDDAEKLLKYVTMGVDMNAQIPANNGQPLLCWAANNNSKRAVMLLLAMGANINALNCHGNSALIHATWKGHLEIVQILLDNGAKVDIAATESKMTALYLASNWNHSDIVYALIKAGASLDLCNKDGNTPLHDAMRLKHAKIIKMLLAAGANTTIKNNNGKTTLEMTDEPEIRALFERWCKQKQTADRRTNKRTA